MAYRPTPMKIVGSIIKLLFSSLIVFIIGLLIWRVYFSTIIPSEIKRLTVNESLLEAYGKSGGDLYMFNQSQASITRDDETAGYFSVEYYVFIPEANQVQLIFRYNNSTLRHLAEDYSLESVPDRANDHFDLTLVKTIDLTPEDKTDNNDRDNLREERYFPSQVETATTSLYNYRRVVFDGITAEDAVAVFLDIYYNQAIDYESEPYSALCLYDALMDNEQVNLTSADRRALEHK